MKKPTKSLTQAPALAFNSLGHGLAVQHKIGSIADRLSRITHFTLAECKALIHLHHNLEVASGGPMDRMRMREVLHIIFQITDEVMLDLAFRAFDKDLDGHVNEGEWVQGLSTMMRGTTDELSDWCYYIYDINGDGGLAREELSHCLKGCIYPGYGVDDDEIEECERDIVEIAMKKLDVDLDGQITIGDFRKACKKEPLLLVSVGPCLPPMKSCAAFQSLVTDKYRVYSGPLGRNPKNSRRAQGQYRLSPSQMVSMVPSSTMTEMSELHSVPSTLHSIL